MSNAVVTTTRIKAGPAGGFQLWSHRAAQPGPRVVVLGGIHGDEIEGITAATRLAHADLGLVRGRVDVVPVCHEAAAAADSRTSPIDGGNLARVFPGSATGGATEQLAHHLYTEVLAGADLLIDMHTSGRGYDMPYLAGYCSPDHAGGDHHPSLAAQAAAAFGADFVWRHPQRSEGRTVSVVDQAIYVESTGHGPANMSAIDAYVDGVRRVLGVAGLCDTAPDPVPAGVRVCGGGDLDRDMVSVGDAGLFLTDLTVGQRVARGHTLGVLVDLAGTRSQPLVADADGYVMAIKHRSQVVAGDLVVCLAAAEPERRE